MESNHDAEMLWTGPYPPHLKERIAGDYGHLSNDQVIDLLSTVAEGNLRQVVLGQFSTRVFESAIGVRRRHWWWHCRRRMCMGFRRVG